MHKKAIEVDAHLRVKGSPVGEVYAVGDASTVIQLVSSDRNSMLKIVSILARNFHHPAHLLDLVDEADKNKDGKINFDEWKIMVKRIKQKIPLAESQLERVIRCAIPVLPHQLTNWVFVPLFMSRSFLNFTIQMQVTISPLMNSPYFSKKLVTRSPLFLQ